MLLFVALEGSKDLIEEREDKINNIYNNIYIKKIVNSDFSVKGEEVVHHL